MKSDYVFLVSKIGSNWMLSIQGEPGEVDRGNILKSHIPRSGEKLIVK